MLKIVREGMGVIITSAYWELVRAEAALPEALRLAPVRDDLFRSNPIGGTLDFTQGGAIHPLFFGSAQINQVDEGDAFYTVNPWAKYRVYGRRGPLALFYSCGPRLGIEFPEHLHDEIDRAYGWELALAANPGVCVIYADWCDEQGWLARSEMLRRMQGGPHVRRP